MMDLNGLPDLLGFLDYLRTRSITFRLSQMRDDSVMVSFTLYGSRVEVDFFPKHVEYSVFEGNEDVLGDVSQLFRYIEDHIRE